MTGCIRRIPAVGLLVALGCTALSTSTLAQHRLPIQINVDHSSFAYGPDESLVELYLAIEAASLDYSFEDSAFTAHVPFDLAIVQSATTDVPEASEDAVWSDSLLLQFSVGDTADVTEGQHFVHQVRTLVPPGEYELSLTIPPNSHTNRQELELRRDIPVPDFWELGESALSDITLASSITPGGEREHPLYKNGLIIQPNANQLYGEGLNTLYYYAEVYETDEVAGSDGDYTLFTYVSEANRPQPMQDFQKRLDREARDPDVIVGNFDIGSLPSGSYFLRVVLLNDQNEAVVEQARKFFVYNPDIPQVQQARTEMEFETSPYAVMSDEEVEQGIAHAMVLATEDERRRMTRIDEVDEQRRALMEFWQKRDPQPTTPGNEYKDDFYRRLQYANDRYSSNRQDGWETDRGRIIIKYGMPAAIEPHLYDQNTRPHEIWTYNNIPGEGQAAFVFADLLGFGEFEMVHSSVSGEPSHPNWRQELNRP